MKNVNSVVGFIGFNFVDEIDRLEGELAFLELDYQIACDNDDWNSINLYEAIIDCISEDLELLKKGIIPDSYKVTNQELSSKSFFDENDEFPF